jgi:hypothetical protein
MRQNMGRSYSLRRPPPEEQPMDVLLIAEVVVFAASAIAICLAIRNLFETQRFHDVTAAQNQRANAYRALAAAKRRGADLSTANTAVVVAEALVKDAEARLPRRSKNTRAYFASKEKA